MTVGPELELGLDVGLSASTRTDPAPEDGELGYTSALVGGLSGLESFAEPDEYPGQCPGQIGLMELLGLE